MNTAAEERRISRKYAYRGMRVTAHLRDGSKTAGYILAWGPSVLRLQLPAANASAKPGYREISTVSLGYVTQAI